MFDPRHLVEDRGELRPENIISRARHAIREELRQVVPDEELVDAYLDTELGDD